MRVCLIASNKILQYDFFEDVICIKKNNYLEFVSNFGCDSLTGDDECSNENNSLFNNVKSFVSEFDDRITYVKQYLELKKLCIPLSQKQENLIRVQQKLTNYRNNEIVHVVHQNEMLNEQILLSKQREDWQILSDDSTNMVIDEFEKMKKQWMVLKQINLKMLSSEQKQLLATLETFFDMKKKVDSDENEINFDDEQDSRLWYHETDASEEKNKEIRIIK